MSVDWGKADVPPQRRGFRFLPNPDLGPPRGNDTSYLFDHALFRG